MSNVAPKHKFSLKRERVPQLKLFRNYSSEYVKLHCKDGNFRALPPVPSMVDLRNKFPEIFAQGDVGSCTANALVAIYMFSGDPREMLSRLFLYYNERELDGTVNSDEGSTLSSGIKALEKFGVCSEKLWPYNPLKWNVKPIAQCYSEATNREVICSSQVEQNIESMKACLASGEPIALGIQVYESFESDETEKTGVVPMPKTAEQCYGGHAVTCVGYDDARKLFIMRNSWGPKWGDKGYFYLPYAYLTDQNLTSDLWIITKITDPSTSCPSPRNESLPRLKLSPVPDLDLMTKLNFLRAVKRLLCDIPPPDKVTIKLVNDAMKGGHIASQSQNGPQCPATIVCQLLTAAADPTSAQTDDGYPIFVITLDERQWTTPQKMVDAVNLLLAKVNLKVEISKTEPGAVPGVIRAKLILKPC